MSSEGGNGVTRRYMLQALGATGTGVLAGCMGGDDGSSSDGGTPTEENNTTPVQTTESNPYELPESEHIEPDDFMLGWMLLPPGDTLAAATYSPSQASEQYGTTYAEVFGLDGLYDAFDFHENDVPETFLQEKDNQWHSVMKVDQLPKNVTEEDIVQQLQDAGYHKEKEMGDFEVYRGGNEGPRAVGQDMHIASHPVGTGDDDSAMTYMDYFLSQRVEDDLQPGNDTTAVIDALNVQDSITLRVDDVSHMVQGIQGSRQPEIGATSVNMETGDKYGAWVFEDEQTADIVHEIKKDEDLMAYFEEISQEGRVITGQGSYNGEGMGYERAQVSSPVL